MFDWIKKLFTGADVNPLSPYQEAILLLKACPLKTSSVFGDYFQIHAHEKTMHDYTVLITKAINALENGHRFHSNGTDPVPVPVAEFFMTPSGKYTSPAITQAVFINAATELIALYEKIIDQEENNNIQLHNLNVIYPIVRNLGDLAKQLSEER